MVSRREKFTGSNDGPGKGEIMTDGLSNYWNSVEGKEETQRRKKAAINYILTQDVRNEIRSIVREEMEKIVSLWEKPARH